MAIAAGIAARWTRSEEFLGEAEEKAVCARLSAFCASKLVRTSRLCFHEEIITENKSAIVRVLDLW